MELRERIAAVRPAAVEIVEDAFAEVRDRIHSDLIADLGPQLANAEIEPEALRERVRTQARARLEAERGLAAADRDRLADEITDDTLGHGPIEKLLADDSVTEIMVNGARDVWIERAGRLYQTAVRFNDEAHLRRIITKIAGQVGRRVDESSPMLDARLPDGSRINAVLPPLSLSGSLLTIRKFGRERFSLDDLVGLGTLSHEVAELLRACLHAELNIRSRGGRAPARRRCSMPCRARSPTTTGSSRSRTRRSCGSTSATSCAWRHDPRTSRVRASWRSATSSAMRCACARTASSSERSAAPRRWTCSRR